MIEFVVQLVCNRCECRLRAGPRAGRLPLDARELRALARDEFGWGTERRGWFGPDDLCPDCLEARRREEEAKGVGEGVGEGEGKEEGGGGGG